MVSAIVTLAALGIFGYIKGSFTGTGKLRSATQTMVIGGLAAAAAIYSQTYFISNRYEANTHKVAILGAGTMGARIALILQTLVFPASCSISFQLERPEAAAMQSLPPGWKLQKNQAGRLHGFLARAVSHNRKLRR